MNNERLKKEVRGMHLALSLAAQLDTLSTLNLEKEEIFGNYQERQRISLERAMKMLEEAGVDENEVKENDSIKLVRKYCEWFLKETEWVEMK